MNRIELLFLIVLTLTSSIFIYIIHPARAQQSSDDVAQWVKEFERLEMNNWGHTHPISYTVFFITSEDKCTDSNYQSLKFYQVIADQYLTLYEITHDPEGTLCIPLKDALQYFNGLSAYDLPIIIMDNSVSRQILVQQGYYGLYQFSGGGTQFVLVCACDNETESWPGGWTLSHELSHFVLHYYGTPELIYVTWVHYVQALENYCQRGDLLKLCSNYSTTVTAPSGNKIPVMEIFGKGSPSSYNMTSNPPQAEVSALQQQIVSNPPPTSNQTANATSPIPSNGTVKVDKNQYYLLSGQSSQVTIFGRVPDPNGGKVVLTISKPDETSEVLRPSVDVNGSFSTTYIIDDHSPLGQYAVSANYENSDFGSTSFNVTSDVQQFGSIGSIVLAILIISIIILSLRTRYLRRT